MNIHQTAASIGAQLKSAMIRNNETLRDEYRAKYRLYDDLANMWAMQGHLPGAAERAAAHRAQAIAYARKLGVV